MSGVDLVRVDGGDRIHLPLGETQLGRGPFLGVSDKRVSRQHALLDNQSGRLRLKPTHLNPCFVRTSLSDDPRPLKKDEWHPLSHGDLFSLLPADLIYRVEVAGGEDGATPRNSQLFEDEVEARVSPEHDVRPPAPAERSKDTTPPPETVAPPTKVIPPPAKKLAPPSEEVAATSLGHSLKKPQEANDVASPPRKARVLPAWMTAAVTAPPTAAPRAKVVKRGKEPAASSSVKQATPRTSAPPKRAEISEEEVEEEEEEPRKRKRKRKARRMSEEEEELESKTVEDVGAGDEEEEEGDGRGGGATRPETPEAEPQRATERLGSTSGPTVSLRTPCPYGKDCYRKNPLHFKECSHPGDTDYEDEGDEEDEEDRPECPYGTDCYRKNPLHRKEFKHTRRPARSTRAAPKKARRRDDEDEEDEEDSGDDSFINDDSEDDSGGSDYVPPADSGEEGGAEDVTTLQREAKAFLRRGK